MKKEIKLYRGDSIPKAIRQSSQRQRGQTFARHFCGNGLMAKFSDGGSSRLLQGKDLVDLILSHVGYELGTPEQELADHSPLISFSEAKESAFVFSNRKKVTLKPCDFYEATHFIWQFGAELENEITRGRFGYTFQADFSNCTSIVIQQLYRGYEETSEGGAMSAVAIPLRDAIAGTYADLDQEWHYAEVIDVVSFLTSQNLAGRDEKLVQRALERATRDSEWLIYPMDPMPDGLGFSSRFPMNRGLSVYQCLKAQQESELPTPA
jgi:hypothetical protein